MDLIYLTSATEANSVQTGGRCWSEATDAGGWTNVFIHRLLEWRPMESGEQDSRQIIMEALRLGSLLYLASIWRKFGVFPVRTCPLVQKLVELSLQGWGFGRELWQFEAWLLVMGAIESNGISHEYFIEKIFHLANRCSVSPTDILEIAQGVLWIEEALSVPHIHLQAELKQT
jgi:hypothetical protein